MPHFTDINFFPPVIAHRGAKVFAPENTLAAFLKAQELGFNWVEFDVMLTADNEVVVIHDEELTRTSNGKGAVIDFSYDYLKSLDAGSWFNPVFAGEKIPTLDRVLEFLSQHHLSANIEIKGLQNRDELLVQRVLEKLEHFSKLSASLLISSFSKNILRLVRQQSSKYLLGFLVDEWKEDWETECAQLDCITVNVNHRILTENRASQIKATGRKLLAYTVNSPTRAKQMYLWGVDAIFSDCPQEIVDMMNVLQ